jgi:hypothetical protein
MEIENIKKTILGFRQNKGFAKFWDITGNHKMLP